MATEAAYCSYSPGARRLTDHTRRSAPESTWRPPRGEGDRLGDLGGAPSAAASNL